MRTFFMASIVLIGLATSALAKEYDGNELLRNCNAAVKQEDGVKIDAVEILGATYCLGYLAGFTSAHSIVVGVAKLKKPLYCAPSNGNETGQLARIVTKYLKNNPKYLHESARINVAAAFTSAFPCPQ